MWDIEFWMMKKINNNLEEIKEILKKIEEKIK